MIHGIKTICGKEFRFFTGSDRGAFLLYLFLVLSWSTMLIVPPGGTVQAGSFWLVFFSVIISANFANTVFIAERSNGIIEILITSGITRKELLFGKMFFVIGMSSGIGLVCWGISIVLRSTIFKETAPQIQLSDGILYVLSVALVTASSAYLSLRMSNPRLLHIVNIFMIGIIIAIYVTASNYFTIPSLVLPLCLIILAMCFTIAAVRLFESEKIIQPVSW